MVHSASVIFPLLLSNKLNFKDLQPIRGQLHDHFKYIYKKWTGSWEII